MSMSIIEDHFGSPTSASDAPASGDSSGAERAGNKRRVSATPVANLGLFQVDQVRHVPYSPPGSSSSSSSSSSSADDDEEEEEEEEGADESLSDTDTEADEEEEKADTATKALAHTPPPEDGLHPALRLFGTPPHSKDADLADSAASPPAGGLLQTLLASTRGIGGGGGGGGATADAGVAGGGATRLPRAHSLAGPPHPHSKHARRGSANTFGGSSGGGGGGGGGSGSVAGSPQHSPVRAQRSASEAPPLRSTGDGGGGGGSGGGAAGGESGSLPAMQEALRRQALSYLKRQVSHTFTSQPRSFGADGSDDSAGMEDAALAAVGSVDDAAAATTLASERGAAHPRRLMRQSSLPAMHTVVLPASQHAAGAAQWSPAAPGGCVVQRTTSDVAGEDLRKAMMRAAEGAGQQEDGALPEDGFGGARAPLPQVADTVTSESDFSEGGGSGSGSGDDGGDSSGDMFKSAHG